MSQLSQLQEPIYKLKDDTFKVENAQQYSLFIQLNYNETAFAIYDNQQERYIALHSGIPDAQDNDVLLANWFSKYVGSNELLLAPDYAKIGVVISYPQATLVPAPLYNKENEIDYIRFHFPLLQHTVIHSDYIKHADAYCIFAVPEHIDAAIKALFPLAQIHHHATGLLNTALLAQNENPLETVHLQFRKNSFDIVVVNNQKLILYNAYQYSAVEDVIYYILYTLQQLKINGDQLQVKVCGNIHPSGSLFITLQTYLKNISFSKRLKPQQFSYVLADVPEHEYFSLLNQHLCE